MKKVVRRVEASRNTTTTASTASPARSIWYGECQKNHAAGMGGYAVDGCREFMASGEEGSPDALVCAACSCHRNFHRHQVQAEAVSDCPSPSNSSTAYN